MVIFLVFLGGYFSGIVDAQESLDSTLRKYVKERSLPYRERLATFNRLAAYGKKQPDRVLSSLLEFFRQEKDRTMKSMLLRKIGAMEGPRVRKLLLETLSGPDASLKIAVGYNLRKHLDLPLTQQATRLLADPATSSTLARSLASALKHLEDPAAIGWMIAYLPKVKDPRGLGKLLPVIGAIKGEEALEAILKYGASGSPDIRVVALDALAGREDPRAIALLEKASRSRNPEIASVSIRCLASRLVKDPKLADRVLKWAKGGDLTRQLAALDAIGLGKLEEGLKTLIKLLPNRRWEVRSAAIMNIRRLRLKEGIEPLIDRLEKETGRLRGDLVDALEDLTGKPFGFTPAQWKSWWSVKKKVFVVPPKKKEDSKNPAGGEESISTYYGIRVLSERVLFVVDISGSMSTKMSTRSKGASTLASKGNATTDTRLEIAKSNLIRVVNGLGPKVYFNVIFFDSSFRKWKKELTRITKKSREEAIQFARQQKASGGTNIYDSLEAAIQTKKVDTIFLLSDGQASQGKFMATEDILREIGRLNSKRRIKIHCIALGGSHSLLEQLAAQSGGRYVQP